MEEQSQNKKIRSRVFKCILSSYRLRCREDEKMWQNVAYLKNSKILI
jgi:hypothetical protein